MAPDKKHLTSTEQPVVSPEHQAAQGAEAETDTLRPLARHSNGLLDLGTPQDRLKEIIQTNATQSPLLRLPPEIRNIIWGFATGYQSIDTRYINHHVPMDRTNGTMGRSESTGTTRESNADTAHIPLRDATNKSPSAFHLPEVCRQIYAETATMSYALNTFFVDILQDTWVTSLLPAQREAIMQIEPDTGYSHLLIMDVFPDPPIWTRTFPSLRRLVISNASLDYLISRYTEGCWVRNRTMK